MGDLMNDTYDYNTLANQYGNFYTPAARIKVEGTEVYPGGTVRVAELSVDLSIDSASSVSFSVVGAYKRTSASFDSAVKETFDLGKCVEVELGYLSDTILVFKGFVVSVEMDFHDTPVLVVTAMDACRLMMQSGIRNRNFLEQTGSDIASVVMTPYSHLCGLKQEDTQGLITFRQVTDDYSFITRVLGPVLDREFLVVGNQAYFRTPQGSKTAMMTLQYGLSLLSFRRKTDYLHCKITAVTQDREQGISLYESEEVIANATTLSGSEVPEEMMLCEDAEDSAQLAVRVRDAARKRRNKTQTAHGECVGLPELVPGRYLRLSGLDSDADGSYYITQVNHSFGSRGFFTGFGVEGYA